MVEQLAIELPLLVVVIAAIIGATLNVVRGYRNDDSENKTFDVKKFTTGLIAGIMAAIAIAVTIPIGDTNGGIVGLFIAGLIAGFGADFAMSKGKK